jgi:hypothetical protein
VMLALYTLQPVVRPALHTSGIDAAPQTGEKAIRLEAAARERVKMQCFLIYVDLFLESNGCNGRERGGGGVYRLNLNPQKRMSSACLGESLLARFGVARSILVWFARVVS